MRAKKLATAPQPKLAKMSCGLRRTFKKNLKEEARVEAMARQLQKGRTVRRLLALMNTRLGPTGHDMANNTGDRSVGEEDVNGGAYATHHGVDFLIVGTVTRRGNPQNIFVQSCSKRGAYLLKGFRIS